MDELNKDRDQRKADMIAACAKADADKRDACVQKVDLVDGAYYRGQCRNAGVARWFAAQDRFTYWRNKFGCRFIEDIMHPDDDQVYDVFYAYEKIGEPVADKDKITMTAIEQFRLEHPKK